MLEQGEFADYTESFPTPRVTQDALPYWAAVKEGRLLFQRCPACRGAIFPPRSICPWCACPNTRRTPSRNTRWRSCWH